MKRIDQEKEERILHLIDLCNQYNVNGYQMHIKSNKKISQPAFKNFINRDTNPNDTTLDIIEKVLNENFLNKRNMVEEDPEPYGTGRSVSKKLEDILSILEKVELKQDIMYEIIKNGIISSAEVVIKNGNKKLSSS